MKKETKAYKGVDTIMSNNIPVPPHQNQNDKNWASKGDSAGYFPSLSDAQKYADSVASTPYHYDRLRAIECLLSSIISSADSDNFKAKTLPNLPTVLDFGIGDGGQFLKLNITAGKIIGVDISEHMLTLAKKKLAPFQFEGHIGSADALKNVKTECVDLALCINTLGYLTKEDQDLFFSEMKRIVKSDGYLLVMTGNELFDLFALNSGTVEFFNRHFTQANVSDLLIYGRGDRWINASRRNPLNFTHELKKFGFNEISQSFSQWHKIPPPIATKEFNGDLRAAWLGMRDFNVDPNTVPPEHKWKAYFLCSIFASLSKRNLY